MYILIFLSGVCMGIAGALTAAMIRANRIKVYDNVEIIENCTVEILSDSKTGECSVGWWRGTAKDEPKVIK